MVAVVYELTDFIDPNASPYLHTIVTGIIAALVLGAWWAAARYLTTLRAERAKQNVPKAKGDRLSIVVAALKNDDGGAIAERVRHALRDELGDRVEVLPVNELIVSGNDGSEDIRQLAARHAGQDLLSSARRPMF